MNEAESLLPCPFCGGQAFGPYIAHVTIPAEHPLNHYQVACSDQPHCGAAVTGVRLKTEADAVKHWNKAHQADAIPRASVADKGFTPDWSLPEATQESLRDHMALLKAAQEDEEGDYWDADTEEKHDVEIRPLLPPRATVAALGLGDQGEERKCS